MPLPLVPLAIGAMGLGSAVLGARGANKAQRAQQQALDFEREKWNAGRAFRDKGTALLNQEVDPEAISSIFADEGNPYSAGMQFRSPMRAAVGSEAPRTAQPRNPTPNMMMGGDAGASAVAPPMDDMGGGMGGETDPQLEARRAQLAAMASMLPSRQSMQQMRRVR